MFEKDITELAVVDNPAQPSFDVASLITNISFVATVMQNPTIQGAFKQLGEKFVVGALEVRQSRNIPVIQTLSSAGGVVGWVLKSAPIRNAILRLDSIMDEGTITPEMLIELIRNPSLIKELADVSASIKSN